MMNPHFGISPFSSATQTGLKVEKPKHVHVAHIDVDLFDGHLFICECGAVGHTYLMEEKGPDSEIIWEADKDGGDGGK